MVQGLAGWMSLTGEPDGPPTKSGLSLVDLSGGYASALALMAGLWQARRDGVGLRLRRLALRDGAARAHVRRHLGGLAGLPAAAALGVGPPVDGSLPELPHGGRLDRRSPARSRSSGSGCATPSGVRTWPPIHASRTLPAGTSTATSSSRSCAKEFSDALDGRVARRRCGAAGVPSARVNDVAQALADPQVDARDGLVEIDHPRLGTVRQVATPLRVGEEEKPTRRAPFRGEDTERGARRPLRLLTRARPRARRCGFVRGRPAPLAIDRSQTYTSGAPHGGFGGRSRATVAVPWSRSPSTSSTNACGSSKRVPGSRPATLRNSRSPCTSPSIHLAHTSWPCRLPPISTLATPIPSFVRQRDIGMRGPAPSKPQLPELCSLPDARLTSRRNVPRSPDSLA